MGVVQLKQFGMPTGKEWIWYCVIYLVALYVIFVAMSFATLEYIRFENGHGIALSEEQSKDQDEDDGKSYTKMPATPAGSQASDSVIVPVQEFVPLTLAFKDLHYFVPNPTKGEPDLELLKGVSGYALPGTVTALMGSSGAGNVGDVIVYGLELSLFVLMNVYFGQLMAYAMPRVDVAASMGVLLNSIFFLFMGFNPPESQIPSGYRWLTTITPPKYSLSILVAQIFAKCENGEGMGCHTMSKVPPVILTELGKENVTVKEFTEFLFNMKYDNTVKYTWVVLAIIVLFRLLGLLSLRYINHQKR
ncbi:unnamed protein product [Aphanomyces euteiches]